MIRKYGQAVMTSQQLVKDVVVVVDDDGDQSLDPGTATELGSTWMRRYINTSIHHSS